MSIASIASLVEAIQANRLLEPHQLGELASLKGRFTDPRLLARDLLQRGWLTAYQINQIAQGHAANLVLGQYVLLERIGEGGMGQVFKARHQRLQRIAAVKLILPERLANRDAAQRFHREALAAARLSHPNIVTVYDADEVKGTHYLAMEYVEGTDLAKLVKEKGPLEIRQACEFSRQAALGLQHAYERGLVHRDIKPHNLLVTPQGVVKILDMGLARLSLPVHSPDSGTEALTREGSVMGTPDYIAPEQAMSSHTVDIRADLYSLGCTLYFLLTGRPPFLGGSLAQKLLWHQKAEPPPIEEFRREVPAGVVALVRKLMAKQPEQRYPTPAEAASALMGFCPGMVPVAVPVGASRTREMQPPVARLATEAGTSDAAPQALPVAGQLDTISPEATVAFPSPPGRRGWRSWRVAGAAVGALLLVLLLAVGLGGGRSKKRDPDDPGWPLDNLETSAFQEVREFDWPPKGLVLVLGSHRGRHWGPVRAVAWSPDGKLIASAGDDSLICVWKADTLQEYRLFRGHTGPVRSLAFSPDSERLLSGGDDRTLRLWDIAERHEILKLEGHGDPVTCLAYSKDGKRALSGATGGVDHAVRLWDLTGKGKEAQRLKGHTDSIVYVAFSEDEKRAFTSSLDKTVRFWDLETGASQRTVTSPVEPGVGTTCVLAISKDGRQGYSDLVAGNLYQWDLVTGKPIGQAGGPANCGRHTLSANGTRLGVVAGVSELRVFDAKAEKPLRVFSSQSGLAAGGVSCLALSVDGQRLISGSENGLVQIWDIERGEEIHPRPGHAGVVHSVALSKDGRQVLTGGADRTLRLWDLTSEPPGREERRFEGHQGSVLNVLFSPDGTRALSSGGDRSARLWDTRTGREVHRVDDGEGNPVFAPETGLPFATGVSSQNVRVVDVVRGTEVYREMEIDHNVSAIAYFPGQPNRGLVAVGRTASPGGDGYLRDTETRKKLAEFHSGTDGGVSRMAFSTTGAHVAWGCGNGAVRRWEVATAASRPPAVFSGHTKSVTGVVESTDGTLLAASAVDGRVIVWDTATGKVRQEWQMPGPVHGVAFDKMGRYLATANANGTAFILRLTNPATK